MAPLLRMTKPLKMSQLFFSQWVFSKAEVFVLQLLRLNFQHQGNFEQLQTKGKNPEFKDRGPQFPCSERKIKVLHPAVE